MVDAPHPEPKGERTAAGALFRVHAVFVAKFLRHLGVPIRDVDDLVQEVFMTVHRKGGYVRGPAQPRTWLAAIAVRHAKNNSRALRRGELFSTRLGKEPLLLPSDPSEEAEVRLGIERVQQALEELPLEQRAAFVLFELEGESCESIAASWEVPVGTIYSRLHHARRAFMQAYAPDEVSNTDRKALSK